MQELHRLAVGTGASLDSGTFGLLEPVLLDIKEEPHEFTAPAWLSRLCFRSFVATACLNLAFPQCPLDSVGSSSPISLTSGS